MPAWLPGAILGFLGLLQGLIFYVASRKQAKDLLQVKAFTDLVADVNGLKHWQAAIDVKIAIFWQGVKYDAVSAAKILHQPHPEAAMMDALIDKYLAGHLKGGELKRFVGLLEDTRDDPKQSNGRQLAAAQMLRALHQESRLLEVQRAIDSMEEDRHEGLRALGRILHKRELVS